MSNDLHLGDCREVRSVLPDNSIDTIITDPPYGLEFMGKGWDKGVPGVEFWKEFLAVTKPGGFLLAFGGTRTFHRMTVAIEDAGWEIRDCMMWLYGSGFPKSHDISKGIDKAKGAERTEKEWYDRYKDGGTRKTEEVLKIHNVQMGNDRNGNFHDLPATELAKQWSGWGTALKPAWEPIIVAMKPLDGTFAANAERHGVAGLNIDGGRVAGYIGPDRSLSTPRRTDNTKYGKANELINPQSPLGRWPANLILDEEAGKLLDEQTEGRLHSAGYERPRTPGGTYDGSTGIGMGLGIGQKGFRLGDAGGASRFFYCAKASKSERNEGCEGLEEKIAGGLSGRADGSPGTQTKSRNTHPTVKPLKLMEYLCTLTKTPTGGVVLDPFAGSGTTLLAAKNTGREYIGIEQNPDYYEIIKARLGLK